jgi:hypothetical protein
VEKERDSLAGRERKGQYGITREGREARLGVVREKGSDLVLTLTLILILDLLPNHTEAGVDRRKRARRRVGV